MSDEFEFPGYWWEPDEDCEPQKAHGQLHFDPTSGLLLSTVDWHSLTAEPPAQLSLIHGETLRGKGCTLVDTISRHYESYIPAGHSVEEWHATQLIYGAHVHDLDGFRFQRARLGIRGLRDWLCAAWGAPSGAAAGLSEDRDSIELGLPGAKLSFGLGHIAKHGQFLRHHEVTASALFEFDAPQTIDQFKENYAGPLHDLILFATREETRFEALTLYFPKEGEEIWWKSEEEQPKQGWHEVEVVEQESLQPPRQTRSRPYSRMLFVLAAWDADPEGFIQRWFELREELAAAGSALFSTLNGGQIYMEDRVRNLIGSAEGYHRNCHDGKRRFLKRRLRELFERAEPVLDKAKPWRKQLIKPLVDTRNHLAHLGGSTGPVLEGGDLWLATQKLLVVVQVNLMLDLGMDERDVEHAIRTAYSGSPALRT